MSPHKESLPAWDTNWVNAYASCEDLLHPEQVEMALTEREFDVAAEQADWVLVEAFVGVFVVALLF